MSSFPPPDPPAPPVPDSQDPASPSPLFPAEPRLLTRRDKSLTSPRADTHPADPTPSPSHRRLFAGLSRIRRHQATRKSPPRSGRWRFPFRKLLLTAGLLVVCALLAAFITTLFLRHALTASLPQLDGTISLSGLSAPVTVTRDPHGVPSLSATNLDDLLFAQGFITAQDRLWQMDALRRHAAGELAEILGPSLVPHDRQQRTLQIRAAADRAAATLNPAQLHQLEAYARGVNAFIASAGTRLPVEFKLLHYTPAPWTPRDTLLVSLAMAQDLSTEFPAKLNREAFSAHLPANLLADLYPVGSFRDVPPSSIPSDLTVPRDIEQIPLDPSQSKLQSPTAQPQDLADTYASLSHTTCETCRAGSNNWAVAGSRSASGAPLLSNDMHLSLSAPDIWYEAALHTPSSPDTPALDVTGFTLPGVPFVLVGRNAHVAWGFTNLGADVQDLRVEHLRGTGNSTEFQRIDGSWSLAEHHPELIRVRAGHDVTLDVLSTTHTLGATTISTPIISGLYRTERRALSLAWTAYDPATLTSPFLAINAAPDAASLVAAFASFGGPSLNLVYADEHHIGFHALGRIPIRGEAIHHPRAIPQFVLPDAASPSDEEDESGASAEPEASLPSPHLLLAAFAPRPRARRTTAKPPPQAKPRPAPRLARAPKHTPQQADSAPTLASAPPLDYTIGNPISPLPVDALDPSQEWSGYVPYEDLPAVVDPPSGILATANARVTTDSYPYALANDWVDPYRAERITRVLTHSAPLTPAAMLALQNDTFSEFDLFLAHRAAYAIDHASPGLLAHDPKRLHQAADLLRAWDGRLTPDSPAAALITVLRSELWSALLLPAIHAHDASAKRPPSPETLLTLYTWNERTTALELLLQHEPARWLPSGIASWDDLITSAAARGLSRGAPSDLSHLRFGEIHPVEIAHPLFGSHGLLTRLLGITAGSGRQPTGGDGTTVKASNLHFGASERFTADLADSEASTANLTTGQSGNPVSPWYFDHFSPWLNASTFPLPLHHPETTHTLTLSPN